MYDIDEGRSGWKPPNTKGVPRVTEAVKEEQKFHDAASNEISRAQFIRNEFVAGKSRPEIAKELGVKHYIVYSATANMYNDAHPQGGGGGRNRGEMIEWPIGSGEIKARAQVMRELFAEGKTRSEIKEMFGTAYATVYAATKDTEGPAGGQGRGRVSIEWPAGSGTMVPRTEVIRQLFAEHKDSEENPRRAIATLLGVDYAVVWAATKPAKAEGEAAEGEVGDPVEAEAYEETPTEDAGEDIEDLEPQL